VIPRAALHALVPKPLDAFTNQLYAVRAASAVAGVYEHVPPFAQPADDAGMLTPTATPDVFCTRR